MPAMRAELIEQMKQLETVETLPSRRIFQAMFAFGRRRRPVGFDEVNARLEEADQNLLAQAVLSEDGEVSREEVTGSAGEHAPHRGANRRVQLKARICEFERAGKFEDAVRVTMELQGLEASPAGRRGAM